MVEIASIRAPPENRDLDLKDTDESGKIPVIDMAALEGPDREKVCDEIARACEMWGFFQLINHGIDSSLLEKAREVSRGFFELPEEEKLEYNVRPGLVDGLYTRKLVLGSNKLTHSVDHLYFFTSPASRKNVSRWPRNPPAYRVTITEYAKQVGLLDEKLITVLSLMLGLEGGVLQERLAGGPNGEATQSMRINYYRPVEDNNGSEVSLHAHSDPGGLTILLQDHVAGLQVMKNNQWVGVDPIPNAFVVNIGDQIEILSNGKYKSVEHRGIAPPTADRLSLASFYSPSYDTLIGPIPHLVTDARPALYKSITYGDYFSTFVKQGLKGKEHIRAAALLIQRKRL